MQGQYDLKLSLTTAKLGVIHTAFLPVYTTSLTTISCKVEINITMTHSNELPRPAGSLKDVLSVFSVLGSVACSKFKQVQHTGI